MLFILTGDIQIGKTRWLERLAQELTEKGLRIGGVIAPGVWKPLTYAQDSKTSKGAIQATPCGQSESMPQSSQRFEKLGIDNVLLPQKELVSFARRRDLAQKDGAYDDLSQSARASLGWAIDDNAIAKVNDHFRAIRTKTEVEGPLDVLIVDELGRLELERHAGLTEALACLDAGEDAVAKNAIVVVRDTLLTKAQEALSPHWPEIVPISPCEDSREQVLKAAVLLAKPS